MQAGLTRALFLAEREAGVVHAERPRDVIAEIAIQALPAGDFHHPADPVQTAAIGPPRARLEHQRRARQGLTAAGPAPATTGHSIPRGQRAPRRASAAA